MKSADTYIYVSILKPCLFHYVSQLLSQSKQAVL